MNLHCKRKSECIGNSKEKGCSPQPDLIMYRKHGIGSGIVEATCKTLVSQRLKRSGMCWKEEGGQAILTFRALLLSRLFDIGWEKLSEGYCADIQLPKNVVAFPGNNKKSVSG